ncbi:MAG: hypothetical protein HY245_15060 [Rhizobiales bacterium]|nr:hypothetical protein [Hyphomicrobiales bacterium]MBI3674707.1 hypothetical protein [Hyphomicrobiales bacterium]
MRRKLIRITAFGTMTVLAAVLIVIAAFYVRLSQGPVSLNFMSGTIKSVINRNLGGLTVDIDGALIERAPGSGIPHFRLSGITVRNAHGNMIARAPRAAIGIEEWPLLTGSVVAKSLDLIGPHLFVKRTLAGGIELGFGATSGDASQAAPTGEPLGTAETAGKSDQQTPTFAGIEGVTGGELIAILAGDGADHTALAGTIENIRVTDASIQLYDEANDAIWYSPKSELVFKRMPYGFVVMSDATIANGREGGSWRAEASATYRRDTKSFAITARINDLVPANVSDEIFALSQFARVKVPLSGKAVAEVTDQGTLTSASAEFSAAAGEVDLPDYLAEPIIVDEGSLRADYDPATGGVLITDSILLAGSSRAEITGTVRPVRTADGRLSALKIDLKANNVAIDAQGTITSPVAVDRIDFSGLAAINSARLDIDDLLIMSGETGIRLRGVVTGGDRSAGLLISGRIRDLSAAVLKKLWPPVLAPDARNWVNANIRAGRISAGEFQINLPVNAMAEATRNRRLADTAVRLKFQLADVTSGYYRDLPAMQSASGTAELVGNTFTVTVDGADVQLPSGRPLRLESGQLVANDILTNAPPATITVNAAAAASVMIEYLGLPDLAVASGSGIDGSKLGGNARVSVAIKLPLIKDAPPDQVIVTGEAKLTDASLKGALPKVDISNGQFDISIAKGAIDATGPARINGVDGKIAWHKEPGTAGRQSAVIETVLADDDRKAIGADLSGYLAGPIAVTATIDDLADPSGTVTVDANLAKVAMKIDAIGWSRPATPKTSASFVYRSKGPKGRRIDNLVIAGPDISIKGGIGLTAAGGIAEAKFGEVQLSDENRFALAIKSGDNGTSLAMTGDSFDARPLIKSMFEPAPGLRGDSSADGSTLSINANIDRIYAQRGEIVTGVSGDIRTRNGRVQAAEVSGNFLSGQPVVLRVTPVAGGRELRVTGRDGGAALRAANLYSKVAGGQIEFYALLADDANSSVQNGQLVLRNFEVRNEAALAQLDTKGKPMQTGPRSNGTAFAKLTLPFTADSRFVRIGESLIRGSDLGATAGGLIRKSDGAIDITGTVIPAYALNSALSGIPLVGDILAGGRGQGVIGLTFALGGSIERPRFQVNPVSAIAPGILRRFFEYGGPGTPMPTSRNSDKSG